MGCESVYVAYRQAALQAVHGMVGITYYHQPFGLGSFLLTYGAGQTKTEVETSKIQTARTRGTSLLEHVILYVACSEWKRMLMRINRNIIWCVTLGFNAHDPKKNIIKVLSDYAPLLANLLTHGFNMCFKNALTDMLR